MKVEIIMWAISFYIVKHNSSNVVHIWVSNAKIWGFFMHEFQGILKLFFKAAYYDQWVEMQPCQ